MPARAASLSSRSDLSALAGKASKLIQSSISKKIALDLRLPPSPGLPAVESDPSQIQQVLMNLAINAAEAIGNGSGVITIATGEASLDGGRGVFLEVRDTGSGMDAATQARIFDPFFTTKFPGARSRGWRRVAGIVRGHKGLIEVTTAPGAGSTFRVLFPATAGGCRRARACCAFPGRPERPGDGTLWWTTKQSSGIPRSSPSSAGGYEVFVAENGPAALDMVHRGGPPDRAGASRPQHAGHER